MNTRYIPCMRLQFPWTKVTKALTEVRAAKTVRTLYGAETGPGLWLVGDEGVYLMPNTTAEAQTIVYARECDPTKLDFGTWWSNKEASFGGGDGIEFIPLESIDQKVAELSAKGKKPRRFYVDISKERFKIGVF